MVLPKAAGTGVVESFDEPRGLGEVRADDGAVLPFHCTAIADGSRTVPVGQPVRFTVVAGRLGRWEATQLIPL
jgi:cold shock CspA family protein